jgi:HNH/Endo VII superfamily nuclease toxin with a HHH motif
VADVAAPTVADLTAPKLADLTAPELVVAESPELAAAREAAARGKLFEASPKQASGGGVFTRGTPEANASGLQVAAEPTPEFGLDVSEMPTLRSKMKVFEEGIPQRPVTPAEPAPPAAEASPPLIDEAPREFPAAEPWRPPVEDPDIRPPLLLPGLNREDALAPGPPERQGDVEAPGAPRPEGPVIAAKRDSIEKFINSQYLVDMRKHPKPRDRTAEGHPRDQVWFWKQMLKQHPSLFSEDNKKLIENDDPPIADEQWLDHHPGQTFWEGDELRHHHVDKGPLTAGVPETPHRVYHGPLHYYHEPGSRYVTSRFKKVAPPRRKKKSSP